MASAPVHEPLYYNDVAVGETWESPARTVTEADIVNFACMTGDYNPLHVDHEFVKNTPFGRPIAHGLLGLSWVAGLGSFSPCMRTAAFVRICDWRFLKPIFVGDTVHVRTEIVAKAIRGRGRRGLVTWKRQLVNQSGVVVQEGTTETLVEVRAESGSENGMNSETPP
jgi:3-hydroxybutyryl-CoA dehydratase